MRRFAQRLALSLGSLVVTLVLLEIGLRIASGFVERERGGTRGETTLLCVGDSHTFGLHVPEALSYPAQLQALLDPSGATIGVVNYGVPGRNSAALRRALPAYLDEIAPDFVLVLVGFNDSWNVDGTDETSTQASLETESWLAALRVVRLLRLARLNVGQDAAPVAPKVFERDGKMMVLENGVERPAAVGAAFGVIAGEALTAQVSKNLDAIVAAVRAHGGRPVLLTYATENQSYFRDLNANARRYAEAHGLVCIDCAEPLRADIARESYAALFASDDHPNERGNRRVAEIVARELEARGLLKPVRGAGEVLTSKPTLRVTNRDGARLTLRIRGTPDRAFHVAFSTATQPPSTFLGASIPLATDPMLARCIENLNLRGRTDADGAAVLDCDLALLGQKPEQPLFASVVQFPIGGGAPVASDPIAIESR